MRKGLVALAGVATMLFAAGHADAKPLLPVPFGYPSGLVAQLAQPGQSPAGANDVGCRPTAEHPNPVVLLNGFASTDTLSWPTLSPVLVNNGYCVFTTTIGKTGFGGYGGFASVPDSAREVDALIEHVLATTGAQKVDIVAHSVGGAVAFYYLSNHQGVQRVGNLVSLGTPFHGSDLDGLAALLRIPGSDAALGQFCTQCRQLAVGSPFLAELDPDPARVPGVRFTDIVTRYDEVATPYVTGLLPPAPNVRNVVLQDRCGSDFADHLQLPYDPNVVGTVLHTLDPEHAVQPSCAPVLPAPAPTTN